MGGWSDLREAYGVSADGLVVDGAIVPRKITQMSFVFDHRVCDGGTAASANFSDADGEIQIVRDIKDRAATKGVKASEWNASQQRSVVAAR